MWVLNDIEHNWKDLSICWLSCLYQPCLYQLYYSNLFFWIRCQSSFSFYSTKFTRPPVWSQNATIGPSTPVVCIQKQALPVCEFWQNVADPEKVLNWSRFCNLLYNNTLIAAYMGLPIPQMLSLSFSISIQYTMKNLEGKFLNTAFISQFHYQYTCSRLQFRNMFSVLPIPKHLWWKIVWMFSNLDGVETI